MAKKKAATHKRRTRAHILEDLSIHHVVGFVIQEGYTAQEIDADYGYDLFVTTFDEQGYVERGHVYVQVKAAESHQVIGTDWVFDVDIRDYNLWIREEMPVILILFDATRQRAVWLPVQQYFRADPTRRPQRGAKTVRVRVPGAQVLDRFAIAMFRELKREALDG